MREFEQLVSSIRRGNIYHSILLHSRDINVLDEFALVLAREIVPHQDESQPCVDIHEIFPDPNTKQHTLSRVKEGLSGMSIYPYSSPYRVYIFYEIDKMTAVALSAFLKIFEEPPRHVVMIFTTTRFASLPATLKSRCQTYYLSGEEPVDISEEDMLWLCRLLSGDVALSVLTDEFKDRDKGGSKAWMRKILHRMMYIVRDRYYIYLTSHQSQRLHYPQFAHVIQKLPLIDVNLAYTIFSHAHQAMEHNISPITCLQWLVVQLTYLLGSNLALK